MLRKFKNEFLKKYYLLNILLLHWQLLATFVPNIIYIIHSKCVPSSICLNVLSFHMNVLRLYLIMFLSNLQTIEVGIVV